MSNVKMLTVMSRQAVILFEFLSAVITLVSGFTVFQHVFKEIAPRVGLVLALAAGEQENACMHPYVILKRSLRPVLGFTFQAFVRSVRRMGDHVILQVI